MTPEALRQLTASTAISGWIESITEVEDQLRRAAKRCETELKVRVHGPHAERLAQYLVERGFAVQRNGAQLHISWAEVNA